MTSTPAGYQPATKTKRFLNYLIDIIAYFVVSLVVGIILGVIAGIVMVASGGSTTFVESAGFNLLANVISLAILYLYYFLFELFFKATPGKFVTSTRVMARPGVELDASRIALRTLIRFVPFEPFSIFFGDAWHDKWSKTVVVEKQ